MSINNTPLEERFGEKLEELREGKNMTREQLAEQVGLTARHIAALERGERRPTLNTMNSLSEVFSPAFTHFSGSVKSESTDTEKVFAIL